jgi:hypothetical protein
MFTPSTISLPGIHEGNHLGVPREVDSRDGNLLLGEEI